jgi:hypothetical protein
MSTDLPKRQKDLHDLLLGRGDVPIPQLFEDMRTADTPDYDLKGQQRWLGAYISALNKSLAERGLRVEPGALRNTYRLVVLT